MNRSFKAFELLFIAAIQFLVPAYNCIAQSVDPLTGRAQVSIPLWTISNADISIPISVWHHGGALRVQEGEGSCGMGWNLSASGAVSRQVRGLPDDYKAASYADDTRRGWLFDSNASAVANFSSFPDNTLSNCSDETDAYSFIDSLGQILKKDSEPDIFYVNAPGLSCQFVFGTDGNPKLLSYQDLKIVVTKNSNDQITTFEITTNMGMKYTFAAIENVTRKAYKRAISVPYFQTEYIYYQDPLNFTVAWHLTQISSSATGSSASFTYSSEVVYAEGNRFVITIPPTDNNPDTLYYVRDQSTTKQLSTITLGGYTASITWLNNLVRRVSISEAAFSNTRQFDFVYRGFRSSTNTTDPKIHRYFLKEIKQLQNCEPYPDYSFKYQSVTFGTGDISTVAFPWETRHRQDYWGYYNGDSSNNNIPSYYFYSGQNDSRRIRSIPISGVTPTNYKVADVRSVNNSTVGFGALIEINYPKGGQTTFTYEPNTYYDSTIPRSFKGAGVRVSSISTSAGEVAYGKGISDHPSTHSIQKEYEYKLTSDSTSGKLTYPGVFGFVTHNGVIRTPYSLGSDGEVMYSRVTEKFRNRGRTVYEFDLPSMFPSTGTQSMIARLGSPCETGDFKNGGYTFPFAPETNTERGFLIRQADYGQSENLVREKLITYDTLFASATTVKGLRFERINNGYHFSVYGVSTGTAIVVSQEVTREIGEEDATDVTQVTTTYAYNANNMLETITRTADDGSVSKQKFRYAIDYASGLGTPTSGQPSEYALKEMLNDYRNGELIETINRVTPPGGTEKVIGASLALYKHYPNGLDLSNQLLSYPAAASYFFQSVVSSNVFKYDSSYVLTKTIDEYDDVGNVRGESDAHRNIRGYHTSTLYTAPPSAAFNLCKGGEAVHENFELYTGRGFGVAGGEETTGWTGQKAYQIGTLTSASVEKRGDSYRISCWAKAAQNTTITFKAKNGSAEASLSPTDLIYNPSTLNTWVYLEKVMNVTNATSPFTVVATANAAITVDDVTAMPASAKISLSTYRPLVGVTSQTDDRGNSVTYTYDSLGRKINTFDRKRNLVENKQYLFPVAKAKKLMAGFTTSTADHRMNQSSTFTANNISCIDGITYSWEIYRTSSTPVATSSSSSITYSFASMGLHNVKLTVSHGTYGSVTYSEDYPVLEPLPETCTINITSGGTTTVYSCTDMSRSFAVVHPPATATGKEIIYTWLMKMESGYGYWPISGAPNASSITITSPAMNYSVKCVITIHYSSSYAGFSGLDILFPAIKYPPPSESNVIDLFYQYNGPCN